MAKLDMAKLDMSFLKSFNKELEKMSGVSTSDAPPRYAYHTGNYVLNKITSGSFFKGGIACQGRVGILAGPSASGKSFVLSNIMREAQKSGAYVLAIDSENALSSDFVSAIGVDPTTGYNYVGVVTIPHVVNIVSTFIKQYKDEYPDVENAPQVLIVIDSLDMLLTAGELTNYEKGEQKGDMGGKNKALKAFLKTVVQDIKKLNISVVATSQVYRNQDVLNGLGTWIVSDAIKYSASTIALLTQLKLRDGTEVTGIRMKCEGYKVRYTRPFQTVVISVPYESGMDPYSGLIETLEGLGLLTRGGAWYTTKDGIKFQSKDLLKHVDGLLLQAEELTNVFLKSSSDNILEELTDNIDNTE
jgi:recombination protein RecA